MSADFVPKPRAFIELVGSKPLVVYVDDWPTGSLAFVTFDDDQVTFDGFDVTAVVFD